jgi:hypothetical protein
VVGAQVNHIVASGRLRRVATLLTDGLRHAESPGPGRSCRRPGTRRRRHRGRIRLIGVGKRVDEKKVDFARTRDLPRLVADGLRERRSSTLQPWGMILLLVRSGQQESHEKYSRSRSCERGTATEIESSKDRSASTRDMYQKGTARLPSGKTNPRGQRSPLITALSNGNSSRAEAAAAERARSTVMESVADRTVFEKMPTNPSNQLLPLTNESRSSTETEHS